MSWIQHEEPDRFLHLSLDSSNWWICGRRVQEHKQWKTITYLPWAPTNPSGTSSANYVALNLEDMSYYDLSSRKFCVSYTMITTKMFRLRGLCQDSYISKINHLSPSVLLLADVFYVAVNSIHLFKYSGITSTNVYQDQQNDPTKIVRINLGLTRAPWFGGQNSWTILNS